MHRSLVYRFFRNARGMLRANGEIHVNHKNKHPFCLWNIEELASKNYLALTERVDFKIEDYPGYNNKRGDSNRCDEPFYLGECSTFKFVLPYTSRVTTYLGLTYQRPQHFQIGNPSTSNLHFNYPQTSHGTLVNHNPQRFEFPVTELTSFGFGHAQKGYNTMVNRNFEHVASPVITGPQQFQAHEQQSTSSDFAYPNTGRIRYTNPNFGFGELPLTITERRKEHIGTHEQQSTSFDFVYPNTGHIRYTNPNFGYGELPLTITERRKEHVGPVFTSHIGYTTEVSGRNEYNVGSRINELRLDVEREMDLAPGRTLNGDICAARELHRLNSLRYVVRRYGREEPF
ncbi:hypothetical protein FNV43_RR10569 [Rhamnella rubrinervis]|uniref:25S rRNA (uridine-N(3))-methyltransferase BMT5-like domain-containing protein n=1 Tax=Rhamnella rubrinervis TaxID=2594499 RepID=A0A8K0H4L7_9ROSA|nr:hypothetical protein FNV43_RR10569 [Rhamnella rubrinervis]